MFDPPDEYGDQVENNNQHASYQYDDKIVGIHSNHLWNADHNVNQTGCHSAKENIVAHIGENFFLFFDVAQKSIGDTDHGGSHKHYRQVRTKVLHFFGFTSCNKLHSSTDTRLSTHVDSCIITLLIFFIN